MDPEKTQRYLDEQRAAVPEDLQQDFLNIEDCWDRKLWHQLSELLLTFFHNPSSAAIRIPLFKHFVTGFAEKINQLQFVTLGLLASEHYTNIEERLQFLETLTKKVNKPSSQDAYVHALVAGAGTKLKMQDLVGARKDLDAAESILDMFDSVASEVHAAFYKTNASYFQTSLDYGAFYRTSLLYLACIDTSTLNLEEAQARARDLSVAALVSDSIYNFGELLLHPILSALSSSPNAWLRDLIFAFNRGDLAAYHRLEGQIATIDILQKEKGFLYQKISLAALTEAVFRRPPHDRAMSFQTISQETNVTAAEIEILIMKALSLGLLRGSVDQVDQVAQIDWVQPKALDRSQIEGMKSRLGEWDDTVSKLGNWVEGVGSDLWAA